MVYTKEFRKHGRIVELRNGLVYYLEKGHRLCIPRYIPECQIDRFIDKEMKKKK